MSPQTRHILSVVCIILALLVVLVPFLGQNVFPLPDRYASINPSQPIEPLQGFGDDSVFNIGSAKELDALPGIGEVLSQRIIEGREIWGEYRLPTDLLVIKGIGIKTLQNIMDALDETLVPLTE